MKLPDDPKDLQPWHVQWAKLAEINSRNRFEPVKRSFLQLVDFCRKYDPPLPDEMMDDLEEMEWRLKAGL